MDVVKVEIINGRVGNDPEVKTVGGKLLVNFSVATNRGSGDNRKTDWHNISAWEKTAERVQLYIHKGDRVYVDGSLSYDVVGEGEAKRTYTKITAYNVINLSPKDANAAGVKAAVATGELVTAGAVIKDEDIPF
jgi:single-strand DNA-binding protein